MPTLLLPYTNISFWNCSFKMANLQPAVIDRRYRIWSTYRTSSARRGNTNLPDASSMTLTWHV